MGKRSFKRDNSGQVLIISAMLIASIFLSTAFYVIEVGKDAPIIDAGESNVFLGYSQSVRSTMISALANVTNGGETSILAADLNELKTTILSHSYQAQLTMDFNTLNSNAYQNGLRITWGANGQGISSAYTTFTFVSFNPSATSNLEYAVNVTSAVNLSGKYQQLTETIKQVNLTITVVNEDKAALAQSFNFSYQSETDWIPVVLLTTTNFGNGTYTVSFNVENPQPTDPLGISMLCQDQRGVFVGANITCTNI